MLNTFIRARLLCGEPPQSALCMENNFNKNAFLCPAGIRQVNHKTQTFHMNTIQRGCRDELTDDSDGKWAVSLVPWVIGCDVGDGFLSDGEKLRRSVNWFHLHCHLPPRKVEYHTVAGDTAKLFFQDSEKVSRPLHWSCQWRLGHSS